MADTMFVGTCKKCLDCGQGPANGARPEAGSLPVGEIVVTTSALADCGKRQGVAKIPGYRCAGNLLQIALQGAPAGHAQEFESLLSELGTEECTGLLRDNLACKARAELAMRFGVKAESDRVGSQGMLFEVSLSVALQVPTSVC